ncbi:MAG TPA: ATP-dependent DNA helicase [Leptospiraceae bacterium]|nr:ATP-dependent DNA helicase [Leptospiraceae bacterium]HMY66370.1 ATP-dependent DNA helicase [Leptospiraceae bacterium]HNN02116.1 ATP-dependent DNA helicase [Leptospiraceae bacterium]
MQYTEEQLRAINTLNKNLQIIACAGSGKTQVISKRIVNILKNPEVSPGNIVAFTYTEKAAVELKNRILRIAEEEGLKRLGMAELFVGTIHAWCLKILQEYILEYQKFGVLDEIKLKLLLDRYYYSSTDRPSSGMKDLGLKIFTDTKIYIQLMTILRESEIHHDQVPNQIKDALDKYERLLRRNCYFDFTMVLSELMNQLISNKELNSRLKEKIKYLVVDEYQDVNPVQEKIIFHLYSLGANICVVGDDDQTIYQWRGSDLQNILSFEKRYNNVEIIKLEDNHRSTPAVVSVALKLIEHNQERKAKEMKAAGKLKYERGDVLFNSFEDPDSETDFLISQIHSLRGISFQDKEHKRGLDYGDFCILVRAWSKAADIKDKLEKTNIPFIVSGVSQLFETAEVKAAKSIFEFLADKLDSGVVKDLWDAAGIKINDSNFASAVHFLEQSRPKKNQFFDTFCLQDIFQEFMEIAGITEDSISVNNVEPQNQFYFSEIKFYNLGQFSQVIDDFETIHYNSAPQSKLNNFLNFIVYAAKDYYPEGWLNNTFKTPNAVTIMTVHQAKGLEYPVVFIPGMNRNYFPTKGQGGASVWSKFKEEIPLFVQNYERYKGDKENNEDERRLFYVALTRSQKFLYVSRAPVPEKNLYQKESVFCKEISHADYIYTDINPNYSARPTAAPEPKKETANIFLNFSLLKDYFECPYRFKLSSMYGFIQPLNMRLGHGKAVHNTLMDIHRQFLDGKQVSLDQIDGLLDIHYYLPYANPEGNVYESMHQSAKESVEIYYKENKDSFKDIEFAEKDIEIPLGDGILVNGRIDLVKKKNLDGTVETTIIDFKSAKDAQTFSISMDQLMLYAMGYKELTGERADFLSVYNLDENRPHKQKLEDSHLDTTRENIISAANKIRSNEFTKTSAPAHCESCRQSRVCSKRR